MFIRQRGNYVSLALDPSIILEFDFLVIGKTRKEFRRSGCFTLTKLMVLLARLQRFEIQSIAQVLHNG